MAIERRLLFRGLRDLGEPTINHQRESEFPMNLLKKFLASEDGPTAVEYAVMLALIVVVCIGTITAVGTKVNSSFDATKTALP